MRPTRVPTSPEVTSFHCFDFLFVQTRIGRKASLLLFQSARPHRFCHSAASTPQLATPRKAKHSVLDKESQGVYFQCFCSPAHGSEAYSPDGVLAALRHLKMNRALKGMASKDHAVEDAVWDRAFAALKRVIFSGPTNYSARFPSGMVCVVHYCVVFTADCCNVLLGF